MLNQLKKKQMQMFDKQGVSYKHLNIWNSMNSNTAQLGNIQAFPLA